MQETRAKDKFLELLDLPPAERRRELEALEDDDLRQRVLVLLESHESSGDFLRFPDWLTDGPGDGLEPEAGGTHIDRYELVERIGRGGFGTVWHARQHEPVQRDVAIKILRLDMDTAEAQARFAAERQALALMDHPHIARIFDGGATSSGRPYLVMDLVPDGRPIHEFCDAERASVRTRLELFARVCEAIRHAHQKGVIHRDLKPNNILVQSIDGRAVPRVIDFGVAKLRDAKGEALTVGDGASFLGTPEYMSPEQATAEASSAVDVRADIYALGVVLYELLCGRRPFERHGSSPGAFHAVFKEIAESEAVRPSVRLAREAEASAREIADGRATSVEALVRRLGGELDWVVMRALEKDPALRYQSVTEFVADVRRVLADQPVLAAPPRRGYYLQKFVRRHRWAVATGAALLAGLVVTTALAVWGLMEERRAVAAERDLREAAQTSAATERSLRETAQRHAQEARTESERTRLALAVIDEALGFADPEQMRGPNYRVRDLLADLEQVLPRMAQEDPIVEAHLHQTLGSLHRSLGVRAKAREHLERATALREAELGVSHPDTLESKAFLGWTHYDASQFAAGERLMTEVVAAQAGERSPVAARNLEWLAQFRLRVGRKDEALALAERSLEMRQELFPQGHPSIGLSLARIGAVLFETGQVQAAEPMLRRALAMIEAAVEPDHPERWTCVINLATLLEQRGRAAEALPLAEAGAEGRRRVLGESHVRYGMALTTLGWIRFRTGSHADAARDLSTACSILDAGDGGAMFRAEAHSRYGAVLTSLGDHDRSEVELLEALTIAQMEPSTPPSLRVSIESNLGVLFAEKAEYERAREKFEWAYTNACLHLGPRTFPALAAGMNLADVQMRLNRNAEARSIMTEILPDARALWGADHRLTRMIEERLQRAK